MYGQFRLRKCTAIVLLGAGLMATETRAKTAIYVDGGATGANDGSSWCDAYCCLQDALAAAAASGGAISEVRVAQGLYRPDQGVNQVPGDQQATFELIDGVAIEGGYAGCSAQFPHDRDIKVYQTILSGDLNGDDPQSDCCFGHGYPGCDDAVCEAAVCGTSTICCSEDWISWCAADAFEGDCSDLCEFTTLTENSARVVTAGNVGPTAVIDGFTVKSAWGHGLSISTGSPTIRACTFFRNLVHGVFTTGGNPTFVGCTFRENSAAPFSWAYTDGAGLHGEGGNPALIDCLFESNHAGDTAGEGGGMWFRFGNPTLINCQFRKNTTVSLQGGGLYVRDGHASLLNCIFHENSALASGGGVAIMYGATATVVNCMFVGNAAHPHGGGLYGGGVDVANCVFWGNRNRYNGSTEEDDQIRGGSVSVNYSTIQQLTGDLGGVGNIADDPLFADPDGPDAVPGTQDDNLRLSPGSPCINTGDPNFLPGPNETDMDGHSRVLCERIDMGAYEFGIGDHDCDQTVDLTDFANWESCFTGPAAGPYPEGCEAFDFDYDGDVDLNDLADFQVSFTGR